MTDATGAVYLPAAAIAERVAELAAAIDRDGFVGLFPHGGAQ